MCYRCIRRSPVVCGLPSHHRYGSDLLAAGWNTTDTSAEHHGVPASHREEIGHTMKNIDSFNKARDGLDLFRTPRCCGC